MSGREAPDGNCFFFLGGGGQGASEENSFMKGEGGWGISSHMCLFVINIYCDAGDTPESYSLKNDNLNIVAVQFASYC